MIVPWLWVGLGLAVLCAGAEALVRGSSRLALRLGVPSLVVGLTIVAFGTSAPEVIVSARAALGGQSDLALGNVVGSNIFNALFILGASALLGPLVVSRQIIWREVPIMIAVAGLLWGLSWDGVVSRAEGTLLLLGLVIYTVLLVKNARSSPAPSTETPVASSPIAWGKSLLLIGGGLLALVVGARWLLDGSVQLARAWGLSEAVIGLTLVAAGTSLPEVATSLLATWRGERDIAVGNVVGSNIFNVLGVLGIAALLGNGVSVSDPLFYFDLPVMMAVSVACLPIFFTGHRINRWEGMLFIAYYAAYTLFLVLDAQQHDAAHDVKIALIYFAAPLTTLTLFLHAYRHWNQRRAAPLPPTRGREEAPR
jgi:cation:H+ antiporter